MIDNVRDDLSRRAGTARSEIGDLVWLLRMALLGAVAGALYTELRKPAAERTWHGRLLGVIPYDFRIPSIDQLRQAYWNPRSPKLFTDRPLGVGWAVNIPTALRRLGVRTEFTRGR
ncbi:MAG TPA: hypothetical protein VM253_01800 [Candidatus Limnocylindrales bacterium]|jgi:hypothetical protein|nr:hypothetical protein [Candidatus Limnocylindrales bacterium]